MQADPAGLPHSAFLLPQTWVTADYDCYCCYGTACMYEVACVATSWQSAVSLMMLITSKAGGYPVRCSGPPGTQIDKTYIDLNYFGVSSRIVGLGSSVEG